MRKYLFLLLTIACAGYAHTYAQDRIYIDSNDVIIGDNGIFVKINGSVFQALGILRDEIGNFVFDYEIWKCPQCDRDYPVYVDECPWHPKKKKKSDNDD